MESEDDSCNSDELLDDIIEKITQSNDETVAKQSPKSRLRDPLNNTDYYLNFLRYVKSKPLGSVIGPEAGVKGKAQDEDFPERPEKNNYSEREDDIYTNVEDNFHSDQSHGFSGEIARALDLETGLSEGGDVGDSINETSRPSVVLVHDDKMFIQEITENGKD